MILWIKIKKRTNKRGKLCLKKKLKKEQENLKKVKF